VSSQQAAYPATDESAKEQAHEQHGNDGAPLFRTASFRSHRISSLTEWRLEGIHATADPGEEC
jgi:hypothetical protein